MSFYYSEYRKRIQKLVNQLPDRLIIHYMDSSGEERAEREEKFVERLIAHRKRGETGIIKKINPLDLEALTARVPFVHILLMKDGYHPAYGVVTRDPETGALRRLTPEEEEREEKLLEGMSTAEREQYWREREKIFFERFRIDRKEETHT